MMNTSVSENQVMDSHSPFEIDGQTILITIDGPAGAGKTTISRCLAGKLGYRYLDTGALYRAIAWAIHHAGLNPDSENDSRIEAFLKTLLLQTDCTKNLDTVVRVNGRDVSAHIRSLEIGMLASTISAKPAVRRYLLELQQEIGRPGGVVCEGRDMGTVVFPHADIKFYLDASREIRARRRLRELPDNSGICLEDLISQIQQRDQADSTREIAPLKMPDDAILIDSSDLDIDGVIARMEGHLRALARNRAIWR
ncbi:MAG: (d)CMP kinase [Desulfatirhabdiaceae bacterium]